MTDNDMLTQLAKMDGMIDIRLQMRYYPDDSPCYDWMDASNGKPVGRWYKGGPRDEARDYLRSHEAIYSLIKKQGDDILVPLMKWLYPENDDIGIMKHVFLATPRQLCEALLKVKGLWK